MLLAAAEVHLFKDESDKALKAATDAAVSLGQVGESRREASAFQMAAGAALVRGNGPRAVTLANSALAAAQRSGDPAAQASAWLTVTSARFAASGEDALEASRKALALCRAGGSRVDEAATLILQSQVQLSREDPLAALAAAREAVGLAREAGSHSQVGGAAEMVVEALLASGSKEEALSDARELLRGLPLAGRGAATVTSAQRLTLPPRWYDSRLF